MSRFLWISPRLRDYVSGWPNCEYGGTGLRYDNQVDMVRHQAIGPQTVVDDAWRIGPFESGGSAASILAIAE